MGSFGQVLCREHSAYHDLKPFQIRPTMLMQIKILRSGISSFEWMAVSEQWPLHADDPCLVLRAVLVSVVVVTPGARPCGTRATPDHLRPSAASIPLRTPDFRTKILDLRGFDSSIILTLRDGIVMSKGNSPEVLSQAILVWIIVVGRLGVCRANFHHAQVVWRGSLRRALVQLACPLCPFFTSLFLSAFFHSCLLHS